MSFGFSIGDIVLLSKLAYDLYSSVTTGRKAASRDLQELEDVLFNLRCALDHLGDVAKDVVGRADSQPSGQELHQKLNRMMASCGTTLKELDGVTKKYRESILSSDETDKTKKRNLGDVTKRVKVNWKKVRWDQEKQSLQQYREKLRSHTDAINLVLNSILWSNSNISKANSKINHEKTHSLLNEVLVNSHTDRALHTMVQEIHMILTKSRCPAPQLCLGNDQLSASKMNLGAVACNMVDIASHDKSDTSVTYSTADGIDTGAIEPAKVFPYRPKHTLALPSSVTLLNNARRAFATQEFDLYRRRHLIVTKPAFLQTATPDAAQLRSGLEYVSRSLLTDPATKLCAAHIERSEEIKGWIQGFHRYVRAWIKKKSQSEELIELLIAMNEVIDRAKANVKTPFYQSCVQERMATVLEELQKGSKSVRIMKELEEFDDAWEEWKHGSI